MEPLAEDCFAIVSLIGDVKGLLGFCGERPLVDPDDECLTTPGIVEFEVEVCPPAGGGVVFLKEPLVMKLAPGRSPNLGKAN